MTLHDAIRAALEERDNPPATIPAGKWRYPTRDLPAYERMFPAALLREGAAPAVVRPSSYMLATHTKAAARLALSLGLTPRARSSKQFGCVNRAQIVALAAFAAPSLGLQLSRDFPSIAERFARYNQAEFVPTIPCLDYDSGFFGLIGAPNEYRQRLEGAGWRFSGSSQICVTRDALQAAALVKYAAPDALAQIEALGLPESVLRSFRAKPLFTAWAAFDQQTRAATVYAGGVLRSILEQTPGFEADASRGAFRTTSPKAFAPFAPLLHPAYSSLIGRLTAASPLIDVAELSIDDLFEFIDDEDKKQGPGGAAKAADAPEEAPTLEYDEDANEFVITDARAAASAGIVRNAAGQYRTASARAVAPLRSRASVRAEAHIQLALAREYAEAVAAAPEPFIKPPPAGLAYDDVQIEAIRFCLRRPHSIVADDMGLGKAQPLSELVQTPAGPRAIGDLRPGDEVIGSNGRPTRVTSVYPQGVKDVRRVTFSDGAETRCCEEHLWTVSLEAASFDTARVNLGWMTLPLAEIERLMSGPAACRFRIPTIAPVHYAARALADDPLVAGAELAAFCAEDLHARIEADVRLGSLSQRTQFAFALFSAKAAREPNGAIALDVASPALAADILDLLRSLGALPALAPSPAPGRQRIRTPGNFLAWASNLREAEGDGDPAPDAVRRIVAIEAAGREECACIAVAASDQLYATRDYILTHNTVVGAGLVANIEPRQALIVAMPPSIKSWQRHLADWAPHAGPIHVARGDQPVQPGVTIVSDARLAKSRRLLETNWDLVLIDEAHRFKNGDSLRSSALWDPVSGLVANAARSVDLTGTLIPNRPQDLYNTLHAKLPEIFHSREAFQRLYGVTQLDKAINDVGAGWRRRQLGQMLRDTIMIRRLKTLPVAKRRHTIVLPVDDPAVSARLAYEMNLLQRYNDEPRPTTKQRILAELEALRLETAMWKIPHVADRIAGHVAAGRQPLVFGHHTQVLDALAARLRTLGVNGYDFVVLHGKSTSARARQDAIDAFQGGQHDGVIAGIKAAGTALTITRADLVGFIELDWTPYDLIQAEDRAYRRGQLKDVDVEYYVLDNSVDLYIAGVNNMKIRINSEILDPIPETLADVVGIAA